METNRTYGGAIWTDGLVNIDGRWIDREEYESRADFYDVARAERSIGCNWQGVAVLALAMALIAAMVVLAH